MKKIPLFAAGAALFALASCDINTSAPPTEVIEKNTTIVNPPAKEEKTIIVTPPAKEEKTIIVTPPASTTTEEKKTTETTR